MAAQQPTSLVLRCHYLSNAKRYPVIVEQGYAMMRDQPERSGVLKATHKRVEMVRK
jgi:hypothetical protein